MLQLDLSNKVAVVTGGSGELGRVMAKTLVGCGAAVAVHYLHGQDRAEAVCRDIVNTGGKAITVQADVDRKSVV